MSIATAGHKHTNRLIDEASPYLLQHAHNPVDWHPWGAEAFELAAREDKPIFLSIGYSTCHWCHVMEHESFENENTARIMNDHFVSIKVDREHRPDVDKIYMDAVVMMTGSGGWPLSVFLTPEGKPFFGGTYFPPENLYGRPSFERILLSVADAWKNKRQQLLSSAGKLTELLGGPQIAAGKKKLSPETLSKAFHSFRDTSDPVNGGFGAAPKFPQPANLSMLLSYWYRTRDGQALSMVEQTLGAMADGGIYDHLGGGFHRYSTDARWLVPHFEKMLYDQALLSKVYLQAYQITGNEEYGRIAREVFDYVLRDMTDPGGGFYSAEDADSEGEEGTFYLWDPEQIEDVLGKDEAKLFNAAYGITKRGNFEKGKTILNVTASIEQLAEKFETDEATVVDMLSAAGRRLFGRRAERARPHRDDKVITAWNGLMISSLAYGGTVLNERKYTQAAERSAQFLLGTLHENGRLMRYYRDGRVIGKGFLDDYAFLIMGLIDLYEATFDPRWLIEAKKLSAEMIGLFADSEQGGFFLAGNDSDELIAHTKPSSDGAVPSGNSIAAMVLLKLGRLTMNSDFSEQGSRVLEAFSGQLDKAPCYAPAMLETLSFALGPASEIVIAGRSDAADTKQMLELVGSRFLPNTVVLLHDSERADSALYEVVLFLKNHAAIEGRATAYVCENYACKKPVSSLDEFEEMLGSFTEESRQVSGDSPPRSKNSQRKH
ncbi:MAG: thioredoxin domain-containing protein [Planctomycetota bacterium]